MRTFQIPLRLSSVEGRTNLLDFGPVGRPIGRCGTVNLGDVETDRTLMVHSLVGGKRHRGTSGDRDGGSASARSAAHVASEVLAAEIGNRAVVVCVLADVLILCALSTVGGQVLEDVCTFLEPLLQGSQARGIATYSDPAQPLRGLRGEGLRRRRTS